MDKNELINGYFEGSLSENQLEEFARLLKTDTAFASDFEFQKELQRSLKKEERQEIKAMFAGLNIEATTAKTRVVRMRPRLIAASFALLIALGSWLLFFNNTDLNTDQLYAANFAPYENVVHPIERGEQLEDLKTRAFTAYEDQDYMLALKLFEELQIQQGDPYIDFYEAVVLMQLNRHQEAASILETYIKNDGQLKDRARWYLALSYLKLRAITKSEDQLQKLIDRNGFKQEAAKELLKKLD